jgi:hypothetical protein
MFDRALRSTPRPQSAQRAAARAARPAATPALGVAAWPRAGFSQLAIHPPRPSRTGLPDRLRSGIERLSGVSMEGVRVHYNSARPKRLDALAIAQGREIHLAAGQERHLPHEAWHLVQQAQGRVKPTLRAKTGESVNDDTALEREADAMGAKASTAPLDRSAITTAGRASEGQAMTGESASGAPPAAIAPPAQRSVAPKVAQLQPDDTYLGSLGKGLKSGLSGFFQSLKNVPKKENVSSAHKQLGQFLHAVSHPVKTVSTLSASAKPHLDTLDRGHTLANTGGDMLGGSIGLLGTTALASLALRRPYLASRFGKHLMKKWTTIPKLQYPFLQHPKVARFAVTRPLSIGIGSGLGAASFYGSAETRASDARENNKVHPQLQKALENARVGELGASLLSRAVPKIRREKE